MRLSFFSPKKENKFFLGLDVGTETIKALIFEKVFSEGQASPQINILGASLNYFEKENILRYRNLEQGLMVKIISTAVKEALKSLCFSTAVKAIKEKAMGRKEMPVIICLPADILKSRVVSQFFFRTNPKEKISKTEEEKIRKEVLKKSEDKISEGFARDFGILPKEIHWVSSKILGVRIDGYNVSSLEGYTGQEIEFKSLISFLPEEYFKRLGNILGELKFKNFEIVHQTESLPILLSGKKKYGIWLDIGGDITQIFLSENGTLSQVAEMSGGGRLFSNFLAKTFNIDEEGARVLKESYSNKTLSNSATQKIKEKLRPVQKKWHEDLKIEIEKTTVGKAASSNICIFGGGSLLPDVQEILQSELGSGLIAEHLSPKDLDNIKDQTRILNSPQHTPSLLICYH